ncbi:MAG: hypothetical protein ACYTHJ_06250 [Planctomycetota bacterium]|jgi:hypothetical protein
MSTAPEAQAVDAVETREVGVEASVKIADASLIGWGGADPILCTVHDIGESGIFVRACDVPELCVGRRYEVVVSAASDTDVVRRGLVESIGEGCYATVVRTELVEGGNMIGAGLRFDQPLVI